MKHILIIGGTGMLKETSLYFAQHSYVSIVARPKSQKLQLLAESSKNINPIGVDYSDFDLLESKVKQSIKKFGPISLAIIWIHDPAEQANEILVNLLGKKCKYFHIFGSTGLQEKVDPKLSSATDYRKIILGQKNGMWLKNHDISQGVIKAVEEDKIEFLVGK